MSISSKKIRFAPPILEEVRAQGRLRLGLLGGGTDVPPFSSKVGGIVLNLAVNLYPVDVRLVPFDAGVKVRALDYGLEYEASSLEELLKRGETQLVAGAYTAVKDYFGIDDSLSNIEISICAGVSPRSGLGASAAITVALVKLFSSCFGASVGRADLLKMAIRAERDICGVPGGVQDFVPAIWGGLSCVQVRPSALISVESIQEPLGFRELLFKQFLLINLTNFPGHPLRRNQRSVSEAEREEHLTDLRASSIRGTEYLRAGDTHGFLREVSYSWNLKAEFIGRFDTRFDEVRRALGGLVHAMKPMGSHPSNFAVALLKPGLEPEIHQILGNYSLEASPVGIYSEGGTLG